MQIHDEQELRIQKAIAEMRKLNEEAEKLAQERRLLGKKVNWFEIMVGVAIFAAGAAWARFFGG